jgi:hypothetical protein
MLYFKKNTASAAVSSYVRIQLAELLYMDIDRHIAYVDTDSAFVIFFFRKKNR